MLTPFLKKHRPDILNQLKELTMFLDSVYRTKFNGKHVPILARIYCLRHGLTGCPICQNPDCSNPVKWLNGENVFQRYCCHDCCIKDKEYWNRYKRTMVEHHGVDNPMKSKAIRDKAMMTNIERLGVNWPMQSLDVLEKSHNTVLERHGVDNISQLQETKNKVRESLKKYDIDKIREKARRTCKERHGYDYYTQSPEYHKTAHRKYANPKYPDMSFGSSWEFKVYDFLTERNVSFEYQPNILFKYEYLGTTHTYHPDFLINGKLYEIKGEQFFKEDGTMQNPYDSSQDARYEAKHQCMIANNVIILRKKDIDNLEVVYSKYLCTK